MDQERTYKWIQDRIRELHSGTLSEGDRIQLEEIAKNDPFLQDAMEGFRSTTHHDHSRRLTTLSQRIKHKSTTRRRIIPFRNQWALQAVAASLVFILVTWAVFYYVGKENTTVFVASDLEQSEPSTPPPTIAIETVEKEEVVAIGETSHAMEQSTPGLRANAEAKAKEYLDKKEKVESPSSGGIDQPTTSASEREAESVALSEPSPVLPDDGAEMKSDDSRVLMDKDVSSQESLSKRDEGFYANQMNPAIMANRITGQVMDPFGQPITGAQISIANTTLTTTADTYGQFEIFLPDRIATVEFYSPGYADTIVQMTRGTENFVVMLSPLTPPYATFSNTGKEMPAAKTSIFNTSGNASHYLSYLSSASKFPIQSNLSGAVKQVTLEFTVDEKGRPASIRVAKSTAGKAFENEAVRLVENGPDWFCEKSYPCSKEYTIFFR